VNRTVGTILGSEVSRRHGEEGLPEDTIRVQFTGSAGQSLGAFLPRGVTITVDGEANDYCGKGLSGGKLIVRVPSTASYEPGENIIVGNVVLYGATDGEAYFQGVAGERFCVRNSGANAVTEGVGDHGCEYMTGGVVVVIGATGRNFAAGMSGGIAYVLDEQGGFRERCNMAMVELEPVPEEDDILEKLHHHGGDLETKGRIDVLAGMSGHDAERLHQMIANHAELTGSRKAKAILADWAAFLPRFVKVMPVEYRRALMEMDVAQQKAAE
jgi:glutamate synthase (NADPH/NADH) large chain